jgi:hypothetical protein
VSVFERLPNSVHYVLGVSASIAMLAGCNSNAQLVPVASLQQTPAASMHLSTVHSGQGASWMDPDAKKGRLLYISDAAKTDGK